MGLFDEIGKEIGKFAKTAADKTSNMVETTRLGAKIGAQREGVTKLKERIGDFYWAKYAAGESCDPALEDVFREIEAGMAQIASLEAEVRVIKESEAQAQQTVRTTAVPADGVKCDSCGAPNEEGARFCRECGSAILQQAAESGVLLCPTCGAQLAAEAKFCGECGGKV